MSQELRCLAIRQPWAWAIVAGAKDIENRSWTTDYRGPVVIQASSAKTQVSSLTKEHKLPPREFAFGALIGVADLVDVVPLSEQLEANGWAWGPYCWLFRNARAFKRPIPLKGKLNLYTLSGVAADQARGEITTAAPVERDGEVRAWLDAMVRVDSAERTSGHFDSYLKLEDGQNALRLAQALLASGRSADALANLARAQVIADDMQGAIKTASEAIETDETCADAWFVRSIIYSMLSENDRARAAEIDPSYGEEEGDADEDGDTDD